MDVADRVRGHYGRKDLEAVALDALRGAGVDVETLEVGDLSGLDQLHAGGRPATEHLLDVLDLTPDSRVVDVGSGAGGPARLAAHRHGCRVSGVDLTPELVELARALTRRVGLDDRVTFDVGSGTALPFPDAAFDRAMFVHVGMNVPDKAGVFAEVRRVLEPGGRFGVFEQMRVGDAELIYPLPWADDETSSFVVPRDRYAEMLVDAGFRIDLDEDRVAAVAEVGLTPPGPGSLTPEDLIGAHFAERAGNAVASTMAGALASIVMVATAV